MKYQKLILNTWEENVDVLIEIIGQSEIPSRHFTNPAVIKCIKKYIQKSILDIGCGEDWLSGYFNEEGF